MQAEVYARFSPLIGGPPFLPPLHVEVLIYDEEQSNNEDQDHSIILHRIDYVPKNPTDPNTILNLLMLKPVPGNVRHRIYLSKERRTTMEQTTEDWNMADDTHTSIILVHKDRIQSLIQDATISLCSITTSSTAGEDDFISKLAPSLNELLVEKKQRDLHLLHHNCYSFAYDVYTCIKKQSLI